MGDVMFVTLIVLVIVVSVVGLISLAFWAESKIFCPKVGEQLELPTKYNFWIGKCFVQDRSGQWVDVDNFTSTQINN